MTVLLSASLVDQAAPIYTVEDVVVHRHFAGSLGSRLITELTLTSSTERITVTIRDTRHSRFQKADSAFAKGSQVRVPGGLKGTSVSLRPDQLKPI